MSRVELTDFLLARIAEDEAVARAAIDSQLVDEGKWIAREDYVISETKEDVTGQDAAMTAEVAAHIARWDPARVLAECDAKRRIVEFAKSSGREREYTDRQVGATFTQKAVSMAIGMTYSSVLRFLALPYADHPDWREEWRP